jgi:hypothetical protein
MYRPGRETNDSTTRENDIANGVALPFELDAELKHNGEQITLLQTCNWQGHSPSFVGVDTDGNPLIVSFSEVRILDRRVVPNDKLTRGMVRSSYEAERQKVTR